MSELLIVEDDAAMARAMQLVLRSRGQITSVRSASSARRALGERSFDLVLTDYELRGGTGLDVLAAVDTDRTPVIVVTAFASKELAIRSVNAHAFGFIEKPFDTQELLALVDAGLARRKGSASPMIKVAKAPPLPKRRSSGDIGGLEQAVETLRTLARNASSSAEHRAVTLRDSANAIGPRLASAAERWRLTPRETDVLAQVVEGRTNRTVGELLGCVEHTIEIHVTHLLEKAGVECRAALIARFWTET